MEPMPSPTRASASTHTALDLVRLMLHGAFVGKGWQGPTLAGCLRGVSASEALKSPGKGRKCIWQQVQHAAYWKYVVLRAVSTEEVPNPGLTPANWPRVPSAGLPRRELERLWKADIARLKDLHARLVATLESLDDEALWEKSQPTRKRVRAVYLVGTAAHDVYHVGQIQLIKKMVR